MIFYKIDLLYRVLSGLYGLYVFHNSLYAGLYPGLYSLYGTYTRLNLGFRGTNLPRATRGGDERVDVLGRLLFPRRLGDEI